MNSFLEKNLQFVSKYNPELADKIRNHTELQADYEINEAASGDSILFKNAIAVDDAIDPIWSAVETCSEIKHNCKKSIVFLLGLGTGYSLKEIAKRYKGNIIVHEPNIDFLRIAFELTDFSEQLSKKNIIITHKTDEIQTAYNWLFFKGYKFNFIASKYYQTNEIRLLDEIKREASNLHSIFEQNYSNLWKKNGLWSNAFFNNLVKIAENQDMHILKDSFKNKTAVIISAGPSLDKNIENIKPYRDKLVIFCVGVAFKTAIKYGVVPDFVMSLDNFKEILDIPEINQINLILGSTIYPSVFELKPKRCFVYYNKTTPVCQWAAQVLGIKELQSYETAGTVSASCFYAAKYMGCDKIIFIGQDLAYSDNRCYSKNSDYKDVKFDPANAENLTDSHEKFLNEKLIQIRGQDGSMLYTRPDYYLFILYFQKFAKEFASSVKLVNATEGGVFLEGFEHTTLFEALEKYTDEKIDVESALVKFPNSPGEISARKKRLSKELKTISANDKEIKRLILSGFNESYVKYFEPAFHKRVSPEERKKAVELYIKDGLKQDLSPEEKILLEKNIKLGANFIPTLKNNVNKLFDTSPKLFSENIKCLKNTFMNLRKLIESNAIIKYGYLTLTLDISNKILDFEKTDEELIELSYELHFFFVSLSSFWFYYEDKIKTLIAELEK